MTLDQRTDAIRHVRAGLAVLVYPLQYAVNIPAELVDWAGESFTRRERLQEENEKLRRENAALRSQLQKLTFIAIRIARRWSSTRAATTTPSIPASPSSMPTA